MRVSEACKVEKCAAKEVGRYAFHLVRLDVDRKEARAIETRTP